MTYILIAAALSIIVISILMLDAILLKLSPDLNYTISKVHTIIVINNFIVLTICLIVSAIIMYEAA